MKPQLYKNWRKYRHQTLFQFSASPSPTPGTTGNETFTHLDLVKRIWYLSHMRAAKVQASLRIRAVAPESPLLANTSNESRGTFRQKARSLAPLNGWACAVKICHDGMLEDTNSLDGAHFINKLMYLKASFFFSDYKVGPVKRICVFEHSVMTNFNCACPAVQRGQGSCFLSEGSSWLAARIGDKYQIRLTRPK